MSPEKISSFIVTFGRLIALILIIVGCAYQTWGVTMEYFEYQTTTKISVQDYDEVVLTPSVVLCMRFEIDPRVESRIGKLFASDFFNDGNNSYKIYDIKAKIVGKKKVDYVIRKFIRYNRYCILIKIRDKFRMEEVTSPRFGTTPYFFSYMSTLEPLFSEYGYIENKKCLLKQLYFYIVTDETLANKANHFYVQDICTEHKDSFRSRTHYILSINMKLPPPYDSNCLDYKTSEGNFNSSHECFDECLRKMTEKYGVVPAATIIDRQKYNKSMMHIAPASILENEEALARLKTNKHLPENRKNRTATVPEELFKKYQTVHDKWKEIKKTCKDDCNQPDCVYERITPELSFFEEIPRINSSKYFPTLSARSRPSDQPITVVTWVPKQQLLDYIVYVCSGISFWVGFCPLAVVDKFEAWTRLKLDQCWKKRRPKRVRERRIRLNKTNETKWRSHAIAIGINHEWSQYARNTAHPRPPSPDLS